MDTETVEKVLEAVVLLPGDTLVVSFGEHVEPRELDAFTADMRARLGEDVRVVAIGGAVNIHVLRHVGES